MSTISVIAHVNNDPHEIADAIIAVLKERGLSIIFTDNSDGVTVVATTGGASGSNIPVDTTATVQGQPEVPVQSEPSPEQEIVIALGSVPPEVSNDVELSQHPESTAAAEIPSAMNVPAPITKTGIVFIKSLLPSIPVPYKCNLEANVSELHVSNVAFTNDLVSFSYRSTVFKYPLEKAADGSETNGDLIRVVFTLDNLDATLTAYLKVVEDADDNHVIFGQSDTHSLQLVEPSTQG